MFVTGVPLFTIDHWNYNPAITIEAVYLIHFILGQTEIQTHPIYCCKTIINLCQGGFPKTTQHNISKLKI